MKNIDEKLYKTIEESKFVKKEELQDAYTSSKEVGWSLSDTLIFRGLITEEILSQLVAGSLNVPYVSLRGKIIPEEVLNLVSETLARKYRIVPFEVKEKVISLAMEDPQNFEAIEMIRRRTSFSVNPFFASPAEIFRTLAQYKRDIKKQFDIIVSQNIDKVGISDSAVNLEKLIDEASDLPIVKILNALLEYAVAENASDVHFEVLSNLLVVRLRVDGILRDILTLPKNADASIVARIKVLSNLKIDEHRIPQDGRFKFQIDENAIGLRVSIIPSFFGENVVLRLLPESARPLSLEELGIIGKNLEIVRNNIKKPHGMILVTGPTGSGKTTTLYSILNILNSIKVKICTIEDPIEYSINRISQIQVNPKTGLDFAMGLRALLRHDPDIIMVGEIRDQETVTMAIHSSLTGHLVLSTLHTNDAPSAVLRLLDMGAEGYLLTSTINIIIAQRLVRKICPFCIEEIKPTGVVLNSLPKIAGRDPVKQKYYHGKGCEKCHNSGYRGRMGIYEVMEIDDDIRQLILRKTSSEEIRRVAIKNGMKTMLEDGFDKIASGLTSIEELLTTVRE